MKKFFYSLLPLLLFCFSATSLVSAQTYVDTANFKISTTIKPSTLPEWNDSIGAWKVYATYDFDKNGKKEFIVLSDPATSHTDTKMPTVFLFESVANDSFQLKWNTTLPGVNTGQFSYPDLTVADLDSDGNEEIIVVSPITGGGTSLDKNPPRIYIYEYDGTAAFFPTAPTMKSNLNLPDGFNFRSTRVIVDEIDGDAAKEIIITSRSDDFGGGGAGRSLTVFHMVDNDVNDFNFLEREFIDSSVVLKGGAVYDLGVVDFDGDGKKEIWVATWDMLSLAIYEATGANTYALQADLNEVTNPYDIGFRHSMKFYDANKDGKLEMYAAGITGDLNNPGAVFYIGNVTDVSTIDSAKVKRLSPWVDGATYDAWSLEGGDVTDIDGDGKVDYFAVGAGPHRNIYRLEYVSGAYDTEASYSWDSVYYAANDSTYDFRNLVVANDLDGDGKKEILIANVTTRGGYDDPAVIILESKIAVLSVKRISDATPVSFELMQNYPNPFNPTSTIRFALKTASPVELFISNALGQNVATLINGKMESGTHEVTFNANGLASGTYFYTLKSGNTIQTKKMTLLK